MSIGNNSRARNGCVGRDCEKKPPDDNRLASAVITNAKLLRRGLITI